VVTIPALIKLTRHEAAGYCAHLAAAGLSLEKVMTTLRNLTIAAACAVGLSSPICADDASWKALLETGNRFMDENRYAAAAAAFRSAVAQAQAGHSPQMGISLDRVGNALEALDRDQEAETSFRQAIAALESNSGEGDPFLIRAWTDLAGHYMKLRRYESARNLAERAVAALTRQAPQDPKATALALTLLASIDGSQHKTNDAEARWRQAMAILDRAGWSQSREWAGAANNLGVLLFGTGRPAEGERYIREALSCSENTVRTGEDKLVLARLLTNLANLDFRLRRFDEANRYLRRALEIFESGLGPTHPLTGGTLSQYAGLCRATKRKAEAKEYERRAKECLTAAGYAALANTVDVSELRAQGR
jgi:tetratricopeptide (TPR) repeat protein